MKQQIYDLHRRWITSILAVLCLGAGVTMAQPYTDNVGIGTTTPDASALFELQSTEKGFLITRMTQLERDRITLPATGLMIYNTDISSFQYNIGTPQNPIWVSFLYINIDGGSSSGNFWSLFGNDSIDRTKHYLGTNTAEPLIIKTDLITRATFDEFGGLALLTTTTLDGSLNLLGDTTSLMMDSDPGIAGAPLVSQGPSATPMWYTGLILADTGISISQNLYVESQATFELLPDMPLQFGAILVGDSNDRAVAYPPGLEGALLQIEFGRPVWVNPDEAQYWSISGNTGIGATGYLGTNDASDLRISTDGTLRATFTATGLFDVQVPTSITGGLTLATDASPLILNADPGQPGQVMISQGPGATPRWTDTLTLANLTVTGTTLLQDTVTVQNALNLDGNETELLINGDAGQPGQILISRGPGLSPDWTDSLTLGYLEVTGESYFRDTAHFDVFMDFPLEFGHIIVGDSTDKAVPYAPGLEGAILQIEFGQPIWVNPDQANYWSLSGNAGVGTPAFLGTTDANDLRISTDNTLRATFTAAGTFDIDVPTTVNGSLTLGGQTSPLILDADPGVAGQVLISQGPGATPRYTDTLQLQQLTVTGESFFQDTATFTLLPKFPLDENYLLVGNDQNLATPFAPGADSTFLAIIDGDVTWYDLRILLRNQAWLVGGNDTVSSPILGVIDPASPVQDLDLYAGNESFVLLEAAGQQVHINKSMILDGVDVELNLNGDPGTPGQVLVSQGAGATPRYTDSLTLSSLTVTGESFFQDTTHFDVFMDFPLEFGHIIVGDSTDKAVSYAPGLEGAILQIEFGQPVWVNPDQAQYWSLSGNAGVGATAFLGTTDANDLRLSTDNTLRATFTAAGTFDIVSPTSIDGSLTLVGATSPIILDADPGQPGYVLVSQGPGATPTWVDINPLLGIEPWLVGGNDTTSSPIIGVIDNTAPQQDLHLYAGGESYVELTAATQTVDMQKSLVLDGTDIEFNLNGDPGVAGQVLISEGPGATPRYTDSLTLSYLEVTGESFFRDTAHFDVFMDFPLEFGHIIIGDSTDKAVTYAPGLEGSVLQIEFGRPVWVNADEAQFWSLSGNAGVGATAFLGTTDANDLRLSTDNTLRATFTAAGTFDIVSPTSIDGSLTLVGATSPIILDTDPGQPGYALVSQGPGATPQWVDINPLLGIEPWLVGGNDTTSSPIIGIIDPAAPQQDLHLYAGGERYVELDAATQNVRVQKSLRLDGTDIELNLNGDPGTAGFVLISQGPGATPRYTDSLTLSYLEVTGESFFRDTSHFDVFMDFPLEFGHIIVGDSNNKAQPYAPGLEGSVLQIGFGRPVWVNADEAQFWSLSGNAVVGATAFLGTTDANDLRIATDNQLRMTVSAATGEVSVESMAGTPALTPLTGNDGLVVADDNGTMTKRDKSVILDWLGINAGRYVNETGNRQYNVVINLPATFTLDANASITITPEVTASVSAQPFIVAGSRTANSFTIGFPGGLDPGEAINYAIKNP